MNKTSDTDRAGATRLICALATALVILPLLIAPFKATALDGTLPISQYRLDVWQRENGLPQNTIHVILQTTDGYIWLATEEGLVRFDGVRFTLFDKQNTHEIKSNSIRILFEDSAGSLWIGTPEGLLRYRDRKFTAFGVTEGLPGIRVQSICEDANGGLWVGTAAGLSRFTGERFNPYTSKDGLPDEHISAVTKSRDGGVWVGTSNGLARFADGRFAVYRSEDGLPSDNITYLYEDRTGRLWVNTLEGLASFKDGQFKAYAASEGLSNNRVWSIYEDQSGTLWVGTDGGLHRFKDGRFLVYTIKDGLSDNTVWSIVGDRQGSLWLGSPGGLNRLRDGKFESYTVRQGLSDNIVLAILEDREGSLWIGTEAGGLNRLKDGRFLTYTNKDGLSNNLVWTVRETRDGSLWIGTQGGGLNRFKDGKFTVYTTQNGLASNIVRALCEDREGTLWIGTPGGLVHLENGKFTTYTVEDGLSSNAVWAIEEGRNGELWIGTLGGLTEFKDGDFRVYTKNDGLSDDSILSLLSDSTGDLWIGTGGGVLNQFRDGRFVAHPIPAAAADESIRAIYKDRDGSVWIGTRRSGLCRLKDGQITKYTRQEGLYDDSIFQILEDGRQNLWLSSPQGVFRVAKQELADLADRRIRYITSISYGTADGMESRECTSGQPAGWRTRDSKMWFATIKGIATINPDGMSLNETPPPVVIEKVIADTESFESGASIDMNPGRDRYEFHYTGLSFVAPEKVRFRYRLVGLDDDWIDAGTERVAHYTNIPPGRYTFRVLACNNDGVWNEAGASLQFYLKPHFYQTYWFYGLVLIVIAMAGLGAYRLRVTRMRSQFAAVLAERSRLAREIHDTLAQGFVGIGLQLKAVEKALHRDPGAAERHLDLARDLVKHSLAEARRTIWDLRSQSLEKGGLVGALSESAEKMTAGGTTTAAVRVIGSPRPLPESLENNLLRVCQEAMTNSLKHARARALTIDLTFETDGVGLRVRDDGSGFDTSTALSAEDGHFGIKGMRERIEQLGGKFEIESKAGEGTEIRATIPDRGKKHRII